MIKDNKNSSLILIMMIIMMIIVIVIIMVPVPFGGSCMGHVENGQCVLLATYFFVHESGTSMGP